MRKLMPLVMAMALPLVSANAIEPGVYYCVIEHMVGIQPEREVKYGDEPFDVPRFAGEIKPDPARFALRISKNVPCEFGDDRQVAQTLHKFLWPSCDPNAKYEANLANRLSLGMSSWPLVSVDSMTFHGTASILSIREEGPFQMVEISTRGFGSYLSEGTCQIFKQ